MTESPATVARRYVAAVTYKPGWTFAVHEDAGPARGVYLAISFDTVDTYTGHPRRIDFGINVPYAVTRDDDRPEVFYAWLLHTLEDLEAHEAAEWFRVAGRMVADPHRTENAGALRGAVSADDLAPTR